MLRMTLFLFSVTASAATFSVIYTLPGGPAANGAPVMDAAGNLYGAYLDSIFRLAPPAEAGGQWSFTVLYSFPDNGYYVAGPLTLDASGNIYGATFEPNGAAGTLFELIPPSAPGGGWTETVLHTFSGGADGGYPNGGMVFDGAGALYGTTIAGGDTAACPVGSRRDFAGCGVVFGLELRGGKWQYETLYSFTGGTDGGLPVAGVAVGADRALYGTTSQGGGSSPCYPGQPVAGCGTVFRLGRPGQPGGAWSEEVLHAFSGADGSAPMAALVPGPGGDLYGLAVGGGSVGCGTAFSQGPQGGFAVVRAFRHATGCSPVGLAVDHAGGLFGVTLGGGEFHLGTVFHLLEVAGGWRLTDLHDFQNKGDGDNPSGLMVGNGRVAYGFATHGVVFELSW